MQDSIFTKMIKGEIPCNKVYEDEHVLAFLDIHPLTPGHTLVVPKKQVDEFQELDETEYRALFDAVQFISKNMKKVLKPKRVCARIEGFNVPHVHVHLYPCDTAEDFYGNPARFTAAVDPRQLGEMAKRLAM